MLSHILQAVLEANIQNALSVVLSGNTTTDSLDNVADNLYQIALAGEVISSEVNKRTLDLPECDPCNCIHYGVRTIKYQPKCHDISLTQYFGDLFIYGAP